MFEKIQFVYAAVVLTGLTVSAVETNNWVTTSPGGTILAPLDWSEDANWSLGHAPADHDRLGFPSASTRYVIRMPDDYTTSYLQAYDNTYLIGERLYASSRETGVTPRVYGGWIFADLHLHTDTSDNDPWLGGNMYLCGRLISLKGSVIPAGNTLFMRLDRFATSSDPVRTDDLQLVEKGSVFPGNAHFSVYAAGAEASTSAWRQTAGSPYIVLADASAAATAAGATVTGVGIPEGTYVRRRITDTTEIELSQPVTETITSNVLSFAAFHPQAHLYVPSFIRQGTENSNLKLLKKHAADGLFLEIGSFATGAQWWSHGLSAGDGAWEPGTIILHTLTGGRVGGPSDYLLNCHFVFDGTLDGGDTTFPDARIVAFQNGTSTARMTVDEAKTGVIGVFTNFVGTLVKDGSGTLRIGLADAQNAGHAQVEAGRLELWARATAGSAGLTLGALSLSAGAELKLPAEGLTVTAGTLADGAVLQGPGRLYVQSGTCGAVELRNGAELVCAVGMLDAYVHSPAGTLEDVPGHPAFWVDASKPESMVLETTDDAQYVTRWNDWRAGEPMFCTNIVRRPRLYTGATPAETYVKIAYVNTHYYTNTEALVWSQPIDHIRAVFLVQDPSDGGGEILGRTTRLSDSYYGTQGGPYYRGGGSNCTVPLISPNYATQSVKFGRFFLNGTEIVGYEKGYLGNFMQLVENHVDVAYKANANRVELCCDAFGAGGYRDGHEYNNANGRQRIAECLIYTNSLTHAERVRVADYLSRKWLGRPVTYSDVDTRAFLTDRPADDAVLDVAEGQAAGLAAAEDGGALRKSGDGCLVVNSLAAGDVTVSGGELVVKSISLKNTNVPAGAWVHVDADDASTLVTTVSGSSTNVVQWRSIAGDDQTYRPLTGTPRVLPGALNGRAVVDCGTLNGAGKAALRLYKADGSGWIHDNKYANFIDSPAFKTVFAVIGSQGGGGSVLGAWGNGYPWQGLPHRPYEEGVTPMFTPVTGSYRAFSADECAAFSNGTSVARLNGVAFDPFTTPFSGGYDLLTVSASPARKSDTLATFGQGTDYTGGLSYGELVIYTNRLDDAVLPQVEAYLAKKWFNRDTPGLRTATCGALMIAEGASVSVCDWAAALGPTAYDSGTGEITVDSLAGAGTLNVGAATLTAGGSIACDAAAPTELTVNGALNLPETVNVVITGDATPLVGNTYDLVTATTLTGGSSFTVTAPTRPRFSYSVRKEGSKITLSVLSPATVLLLR